MDCDIVRDLMPGYIDGVLSEAGSRVVREHLERCAECGQVYADMKGNVDNGSTPAEQAALDGFRKIHRRTRRFKMAAVMGELLAAAFMIAIFLKVFVFGNLSRAHIVWVTNSTYNEQTDSLTINGHIDAAGHISRIKWKENPSIGDRVDLFVYVAETLPFGSEEKSFSVTIPDMKGKNLYVIGSDYDHRKAYDWKDDHWELMRDLEKEIYQRVGSDWDTQKTILWQGSGIRTVDGVDGIWYSVSFLIGEDAYYQRIGDTYVTYGEMETEDFEIWISLEEPHQIRLYDNKTGKYQEVP